MWRAITHKAVGEIISTSLTATWCMLCMKNRNFYGR